MAITTVYVGNAESNEISVLRLDPGSGESSYGIWRGARADSSTWV